MERTGLGCDHPAMTALVVPPQLSEIAAAPPSKRWRAASMLIVTLALGCLRLPAAAAEMAWLPSMSGSSVTLAGLAPVRTVRTFNVEPPLGQRIETALLTRDNRTLLLVDSHLNRVVGIDLRDERSHWSVSVPEGPEAAWLSRDGQQLAVCAERAARVVYIDLLERRVVGSVSIDAPPPEDCAFSPDGRWLVISHKGSNLVTIIDLHNGRPHTRIRISGQPAAMVFAGHEVWLAIPDSHRLEVLDSRAWVHKASMAAGLRPTALAASPDGRRLYVANQTSGTVSAIDTSSRRIVKHVPAGRAPAQLGLSENGKRLLVSDRQHATAHLFDTFDLRPAGDIRLPYAPWGAVLQR